MYNIWSDDRRKTMIEHLGKLKEKEAKRDKIRGNKQEEMIFNYKKRMEGFVLQMVEDPVITKDKTNFVLKMREEDPSKVSVLLLSNSQLSKRKETVLETPLR